MIADAPVIVLPAGIDPSEFAGFHRFLDNRSGLVVGRLSTMWPSKIDSTVLRFWRALPAVRFLVGGEGPMRAKIINEFRDDARFDFPGRVTRPDVLGFLQRIDVFLYDTPWHIESFCYATLEAMAAGCVVVARRKGAIPDQISDGETGFLYDTEEQAIDIIRRLDVDRDLMNRVGTCARESARRRYPLAEFQSRFLAAMGWC
jgi:glycosyltransferase involved in cell wall biosynthesis